MNFLRKYFLFLIALVFLMGCKPDFNPNAEYKDITVVFGLLNSKDTFQYLKIYKAFLTDGNALVAAQDLNNISYFDEIEASIDEYINNQYIRTISFDTTTSIPKDGGIFAYPKQILYYTDTKLNNQATYKLNIKNKGTGKLIISETPLVQDFNITIPAGQRINLNNKFSTHIKTTEAKNGAAYDCYMKFYYSEVNAHTLDTVKHGVISWKIGHDRKKAMDIMFTPSNMYTIIANNLKPDTSVIRYARYLNCIEIEVWAAGKDYVTYLDVNMPNNSIVQEKLNFSNVTASDDDARGIFSSRTVTSRFYDLTQASLDSLIYGSITKHLRFQ